MKEQEELRRKFELIAAAKVQALVTKVEKAERLHSNSETGNTLRDVLSFLYDRLAVLERKDEIK